MTRDFGRKADDERTDIVVRDTSQVRDLGAQEILFLDADRQKFRDALCRTAFYKDRKNKDRDAARDYPEAAAGRLA